MDDNWEELAARVNRIKHSGQSLQALWYAYEGRNDYGNWILVQGENGTKEALADFGLFAAHAIAKLGVAPAPVPTPAEHYPGWGRYCETLQENSRLRGKEEDLSDAVPFGLGEVDRDAVDPRTRAWLEVLRKTGEFRVSEGLSFNAGEYCKNFDLRIADVYGESAVFCKRRARDEVGGSTSPIAGSDIMFVAIKAEAPGPVLNVKLIKGWMEKEGWDNPSLAKELRISERTVTSLRNNGRSHGQKSVIKLANKMGLEPEGLYASPEVSG